MNSKSQYCLLFWILLFTPICCYSQSVIKDDIDSLLVTHNQYNFIHYGTEDGLSQVSVLCLYEDDEGLIWIGTRNGLNVFNGYEFKNYFTEVDDEKTLIHNSISELTGHDNTIWVGTVNGLCSFNKQTGTFKRFNQPIAPDISWEINGLVLDDELNLWISSFQGAYFLEHGTDTIKKVIIDESTNSSSDMFLTVNLDFKGEVWFGGQGGVFIKDSIEKRSFVKYHSLNDDSTNISDATLIFNLDSAKLWVSSYQKNWIIDMFSRNVEEISLSFKVKDVNFVPESQKIIRGPDDKVWISTYYGILIYDPIRKKFIGRISHSPNDRLSLSDNSVHSMLVTEKGDIWVGTYSGGLNYSPQSHNLFHITNDFQSKNSNLNSNIINAFVEGPNEKLYIGTSRGGLNIYDPITKKYSYKLQDMNVRDLIFDQNGMLWIGTYRSGIIRYDVNKNHFFYYSDVENNIDLYTTNYCSYIDGNNNLWVAAWNSIYLYNRGNDNFQKFSFESKYGYLWISDIVEKDNQMWVLTNVGIHVFDLSRMEFVKNYKSSKNDSNTIPSNEISSGVIDSNGIVWLGSDVGLSFYTNDKKGFQTLTQKDGLPSNKVVCLLLDQDENLWVSTSKGIAILDREINKLRSFDMSNNLQGLSFRSGACYACKGESLLFGGVNGFNTIHPNNIKLDSILPKIIISDVDLADDKDSRILAFDDSITLNYNYKSISISYLALDYSNSNKCQYAYRLIGFDSNWNYVGHERKTTYTNLNPGQYDFIVKGSNSDGYWNEVGATLSITILPPWWFTWWAYLIWLMLSISLIAFIYRMRVGSLKSQRKRLQMQVAERTNELEQSNFQLRQLDDYKESMTAMIVHDFKNSLNTVISFSEGTPTERRLRSIRQAGQFMLNMVLNILD
ncbi:MAG: hypothetical protein OCD76_13160, partial [Reichenbachiella sp.]